jgi:hypothetical protein
MTTTQRDETADATSNHYHYSRIVDIAGHVVRATLKRDFYLDHSRASVEVINDHRSWPLLAEDPASNWWHATPPPRREVDAVLGPLADRLLHRAATILAPASTTPTPSSRVLDAVSALLATTHGYDGERRIQLEEIAWASTRAGALHTIEHDDGGVTFTTRHRTDCVFITSRGSQDCPEDGCLFEDPYEPHRKPGQ